MRTHCPVSLVMRKRKPESDACLSAFVCAPCFFGWDSTSIKKVTYLLAEGVTGRVICGGGGDGGGGR